MVWAVGSDLQTGISNLWHKIPAWLIFCVTQRWLSFILSYPSINYTSKANLRPKTNKVLLNHSAQLEF